MTALLAGELHRLLARRLVRVLLLLAVLGIALAGVLTFVNTDKTDTANVEARRREVQREFSECFDRSSGRPAAPRVVEGPSGPGRPATPCNIDTGGTDD
ncbi:MAG: hypothetical protein ACRDY5_02435, partial [Acidimicrobiales bacterium]